ncbi:MAG: N-acetyl-gamma-glutamyl-phosphate reductase [Verrucomicrobiota bacterium]
MPSIPVAVVGASGYSGAELLRLLLFHQEAELVCVTSRQEKGNPLMSVFPRFRAVPEAEALTFVEPTIEAIEKSGARCAFLALPHGVAWEFAEPLLEKGLRVIDLSDDFRVQDPAAYEAFRTHPHPAPHLLPRAVYGLPEIHRDRIADAELIASPGCYPTSILLPLLPLVKAGAVALDSIRIASMSGVSGAGRKASIPLLFSECNESVRPYGAPGHRHLAEVEQELSHAADQTVRVAFTPHLIPVTAGIATTIYADPAPGTRPDDVAHLLKEAYRNEPFVRLLDAGQFPDTKNVVGSNYIDIGYYHDDRVNTLVLCSAEDNIGKGAASQAVQSFNIMNGFAETSGLCRV